MTLNPEYPKSCDLCGGLIEDEYDLDWHGIGNCRDDMPIDWAHVAWVTVLCVVTGITLGIVAYGLYAAVTCFLAWIGWIEI